MQIFQFQNFFKRAELNTQLRLSFGTVVLLLKRWTKLDLRFMIRLYNILTAV